MPPVVHVVKHTGGELEYANVSVGYTPVNKDRIIVAGKLEDQSIEGVRYNAIWAKELMEIRQLRKELTAAQNEIAKLKKDCCK